MTRAPLNPAVPVVARLRADYEHELRIEHRALDAAFLTKSYLPQNYWEARWRAHRKLIVGLKLMEALEDD